MSQPTRKPRFLSGLPEQPTAQPARFATAGARPAAGPRSVLTGTVPSEPLPPQAPTPPAPDLGEIRREAMERVGAAIATLRAQADHLAEQARSDAIEIGFQVARKVLETELRQSPEALFALVRSALRRAGESRRIAIRVAPEDLPLVQSPEAAAALDGLSTARIEFVSDPSLQHGDCLVDADFGQVDGRLTTRLAEIRRAVDAAGVEGVA